MPPEAAGGPPPILRCAVQLVLNPLLVAPGTVTLTAETLRFTRDGGLSGRLAPADGPVLALGDIREAWLGKGVLRLVGPDGASHRLRGGRVSELAAVLRALGVASEGPRTGRCTAPRACTLVQGPLQRPGHLVTSDLGLAFAPSGSLDLTLGDWPLWVPAATVQEVARRGKLLRVAHEGGTVELIGLADDGAFTALARSMRPRDGVLEAEPWASPALVVRGGERQERGRLVLGEARELVFEGPAGPEVLGPAGETLVAGEAGQARHLDGGRQGWRAWVLAVPDAIAALEAVVGRLAPAPPPEGERAPLRALATGLEAVRITTSDGLAVTVRPAALVGGLDTLDLLLPDQEEVRAIEGVKVRLELISARRRWTLSVRPWRVAAVAHAELSDRAAGRLAEVERVLRVQLPWPTAEAVEGVANRRASVRVPIDQEPVKVTLEGRTSMARITSLSSGGASLWLRRHLRLGATMEVDLGLLSPGHPLLAEVAWVRPMAGSLLVGVRFVDVSERAVEQLQGVVYQVELLVSRGEQVPLRVLGDRQRDAALEAPTRRVPAPDDPAPAPAPGAAPQKASGPTSKV